jgi:Carboxypeptidase regulatory-like domain
MTGGRRCGKSTRTQPLKSRALSIPTKPRSSARCSSKWSSGVNNGETTARTRLHLLSKNDLNLPRAAAAALFCECNTLLSSYTGSLDVQPKLDVYPHALSEQENAPWAAGSSSPACSWQILFLYMLKLPIPPSPEGTIRGMVKSGNIPVPGVTVTATNESTNEKATAWTNVDGRYELRVHSFGHFVISTQMIAFFSGKTRGPAECKCPRCSRQSRVGPRVAGAHPHNSLRTP